MMSFFYPSKSCTGKNMDTPLRREIEAGSKIEQATDKTSRPSHPHVPSFSMSFLTKRPLIESTVSIVPIIHASSLPEARRSSTGHTPSIFRCFYRSLLFRELWLPNLVPPQYHIEYPLHVPQQLLIRRRSPPLEVGHNIRRSVALCGQIFLRHGGAFIVLGFAARLRNGLANHGADGFGLDDVVRTIDFGQMLALLVG